jgi:hypothetical protein
MNTLLSTRLRHAFLVSCSLLLLAGCATSKDASSRGAIANLKISHLAFIDEFTERDGQTWDDERLTIQTANVEKLFADAEKYEATKKKDARRSAALANLHSQFKRHAAMLQRRKTFYRPTFATELRGRLSQNYDQALLGEDVRP